MRNKKTQEDYKKHLSKIKLMLSDLFHRRIPYGYVPSLSGNNNYEDCKDLVNRLESYLTDVHKIIEKKEEMKPLYLDTISIKTYNYAEIGNKMLAHIHDASGYGYPHEESRRMFNNNSHDNREHPPLWKLRWKIKIINNGIELALWGVRTEYDPVKFYWARRKGDEERPENWLPLHQIIPTPVLGVHFNKALAYFNEHKKITASYPIDLTDNWGERLTAV